MNVKTGMTVVCPDCDEVLEFDHPSDDGYYWCCKCDLTFPHKNSFPSHMRKQLWPEDEIEERFQ